MGDDNFDYPIMARAPILGGRSGEHTAELPPLPPAPLPRPPRAPPSAAHPRLPVIERATMGDDNFDYPIMARALILGDKDTVARKTREGLELRNDPKERILHGA